MSVSDGRNCSNILKVSRLLVTKDITDTASKNAAMNKTKVPRFILIGT